jgi:hypothetical protein
MSKTIVVSNQNLLEQAYETSLSSSATAAGSTLTVYSISNFAINKVLLIGEFGQEGSEIIKTHTATAPTGTTVTLASALVKSHPKDTKVYVIPYDQVQYYNATTKTGAKTLISTSDVNEESDQTIYVDGTYTTGYYFTRFYNSIDAGYTDYGDPIPYAGLGANTVGYIIDMAMGELGKQFSDTITFDMLLNEANACLRYVRGKLKRWSNVQEFDYVLDQMNRGEYSWDLPSDYYDPNSNRSMLQVKVGDSSALKYRDKIEFDEYFEDTVVSQVETQGEIGDLTLVLDSTDDLPSTGTIHYYISNTQYSVAFTANSKSTNTLTTAALTIQTPVDVNVWYGEAESTPEYFSIWDGTLYVWPLINSTDAGENIVIDYYTEIVEVDSDADEITLARFDMMKHWLKWSVRNITEKNGNPDYKDGDWLMFNSILKDAIRRESSGQKHKYKYKINGIDYNRTNNFDTD